MISTPYEINGIVTTPAQESAFLADLVADSGTVATYTVGQSQSGRDLVLCGVGGTTPPTLPTQPREIGSLLVVGAQHGSWEPAGREAALQYLRDAAYSANVELDTHPLWVIPNWNPDGTATTSGGYIPQSWFANGENPNRDLLALSCQETRAWLDVIRLVNPATLINLHENNSFATYDIEIQTELFLGGTSAGVSAGVGQQMETAILSTLTTEGYDNGTFVGASDVDARMLTSYTQLTATNGLLIETDSSTAWVSVRTPRQVRTLEIAAAWHYANRPAIVAAVTQAHADNAARVGSWDYSTGGSAATVGYTLTPAQAASVADFLALNRLTSMAATDGSVFVPLSQPFAPLIVNALDPSAPYRVTSAARETETPWWAQRRRRGKAVAFL